MPHFRDNKIRVREALEQENWRKAVHDLGLAPLPLANACLACLPQGTPITDRAAAIIGAEVGDLAEDMRFQEQARLFVHRLMWHMNEESGNVGWGVPEAFGEILMASPTFATQYHKVFFSYVLRTDGPNNFCGQPVMRRACYMAIQRLVLARPELAEAVRPALLQGAESDPDTTCRAEAQTVLAALPKPEPVRAA